MATILLHRHFFHKVFPFFLKVLKNLHTFSGSTLALWVQLGAMLHIPLSELFQISYLLEGNSAVPREERTPTANRKRGTAERGIV